MANSPNPFAHKSPFEVFRRNQRMLLAALVVLCMFGFVVLPTVMDMMRDQAPRSADQEVLQWKFGRISRVQLETRKIRRQQAAAFLQGAYQLALSKGRTPTAQPLNIDPRDAATINTLVLARKANDLGVVVNNGAVEGMLRRITADSVTADELKELLAGYSNGPQRASLATVYDTIREELAARELQLFFLWGVQPRTPAEHYDAYLKARRQVEIEAVAVPVADFEGEVADPTQAELLAYFEQYRDAFDFPQPVEGTPLDLPTPGFRIPQRMQFQFVVADTEAMIEAEMTQITEDELVEYYNANLNLFPATNTSTGSGASTAAPPASAPSQPVPDINLFPDDAAEESVEEEPLLGIDPTEETVPDEAPEESAGQGDSDDSAPTEATSDENSPVAETADEQASSEAPASEEAPETDASDEASPETADAATSPEESASAEESAPDVEETPADEPPTEEEAGAGDEALVETEAPVETEETGAEEEATEGPAPEDQARRGGGPFRLVVLQEVAAPQESADETALPDATDEAPDANNLNAIDPGATDSDAINVVEERGDAAPEIDLTAPLLGSPTGDAPSDAAPATEEFSLGDFSSPSQGGSPLIGGPGSAAVEDALSGVLGGSLTGGAAAPAAAPLSEVRDSVRRRLAAERVGERVDEAFEKVQTALANYADELAYAEAIAADASDETEEEVDADAPKPDEIPFPNLATILLDYPGLEIRETPLLGPVQLRRETELGESGRFMQQMVNVGGALQPYVQNINFVDYAYSQGLRKFEPIESLRQEPSARYLSWKTDEAEPETPTLDDVRDQVVAAWKLDQARPKAEERAKALQALLDAAPEAPIAEALGTEGIAVLEPGPFTWTNAGLTGAATEPRLTRVPGLDQVGPDFMQSVFSTAEGATGVAFNHPRTEVYVFRVKRFLNTIETMQSLFMIEARSQRFADETSRREAFNRFLQSVFTEYDAIFTAPLTPEDAG